MTFNYKNVYINDTGTVAGPYEKKGPFNTYFDKTYNDFYVGRDTWEQAEVKFIEDSIEILLSKIRRSKFDIDIHISGDLLNQIVASNYAASSIGIPFLGIYSACATSMEGIIIGANMIEGNMIKNCITTSSSHNNGSEKQFRYPVEYGGPKRKTTTFTSTGAASCYLSYNKSGIKVDSGTIGVVKDLGVKDVYNMGAVMAPAAADTIYRHLFNTKREIGYYDLILTGDLGIYGKAILKEYMKSEYNMELKNLEDSACLIYDPNNNEHYAGGSGPSCLPLVAFSYIFDRMKKREYKRVLLVATGALHSVSMVNQKLTIPSIAHAVSVEVVE